MDFVLSNKNESSSISHIYKFDKHLYANIIKNAIFFIQWSMTSEVT